jgi:hypothetical protein
MRFLIKVTPFRDEQRLLAGRHADGADVAAAKKTVVEPPANGLRSKRGQAAIQGDREIGPFAQELSPVQPRPVDLPLPGGMVEKFHRQV